MTILWPPTILQKILAGVVAVVLLWGGGCFWIGQREKAAKEVAIAEEKDRQVKELERANAKAQAEAKAERERTSALIQSMADQQANLARSMAARNQSAERRIAELKAPAKTAEQVQQDSQAQLGITPAVQDGLFKLTQAQFQDLIAIKVDRDRLVENLEDTKRQLEIEQAKVLRLNADLLRFDTTLAQANQLIADQRQVIEAYKKVAKKTGWQKTLAVGQKVGEIAIAALVFKAISN